MKSVGFQVIARRQLPSYERRGAIAFEVLGELAVVTFHDSLVDVETLYGVPIGVPDDVRSVHASISDTVVVASYRSGCRVLPMLDLITSNRVSQKKKSISERHRALRQIAEHHMSDEAREVFPLAREWPGGLLRAYDEVSADGGGLWLHVPGEAKNVLCMERFG